MRQREEGSSDQKSQANNNTLAAPATQKCKADVNSLPISLPKENAMAAAAAIGIPGATPLRRRARQKEPGRSLSRDALPVA